MWMTLLYIATIAVVAVIVAIAALYVVFFGGITVAALFGVKTAWKKRRFISGLIPDEEMSPADLASEIVKGGITGSVETIKKLKEKNASRHPVLEPPDKAKVEVVRSRKIDQKSKPVGEQPPPRRRPPAKS